jgi:hypothetical protein
VDAEARARKFRQAGLTYTVAGALVVVFTLAAGLAGSRLPRLALLLPGLFFVILFGVFIFCMPKLWRWRWTLSPSRWVVRLLSLTNAVRAMLFGLNAFGMNVHLFPGPFVVRTEPNPLFLINAALMALITFMLARAGWDRQHPSGYPPSGTSRGRHEARPAS